MGSWSAVRNMVQRSPIFKKIFGFCLSRSDSFSHSTDRVGSCVLEGWLSNPCVYYIGSRAARSVLLHLILQFILLATAHFHLSVLSSLHLFHVRCVASTQNRTTVGSSTLHLSLGREENYAQWARQTILLIAFDGQKQRARAI